MRAFAASAAVWLAVMVSLWAAICLPVVAIFGLDDDASFLLGLTVGGLGQPLAMFVALEVFDVLDRRWR